MRKKRTYRELKELQRELRNPLPSQKNLKEVKEKKSYLKILGLLILIPATIGIMFPISLIFVGILFVMMLVDFIQQR